LLAASLIIVGFIFRRSALDRPFARKLIWTGAALFVCVAFALPTLLEQAGPRSRFEALQGLGNYLRIGMTKSEVEKVLGRPDNVDRQNIWSWTNPTNQPGDSWTNYYMDDGLFLVFHNEKLASPLLKFSESDPWEALHSFTGTSQMEAEKLLGPQPKVVKAPGNKPAGGHAPDLIVPQPFRFSRSCQIRNCHRLQRPLSHDHCTNPVKWVPCRLRTEAPIKVEAIQVDSELFGEKHHEIFSIISVHA
jgi:hypothetical protein